MSSRRGMLKEAEAVMARILMTLVGLGLLALGAWTTYLWRAEVWEVLKAVIALGLLLVGLMIFILGLGEIAGARAPKTPSSPPGEDERA